SVVIMHPPAAVAALWRLPEATSYGTSTGNDGHHHAAEDSEQHDHAEREERCSQPGGADCLHGAALSQPVATNRVPHRVLLRACGIARAWRLAPMANYGYDGSGDRILVPAAASYPAVRSSGSTSRLHAGLVRHRGDPGPQVPQACSQ